MKVPKGTTLCKYGLVRSHQLALAVRLNSLPDSFGAQALLGAGLPLYTSGFRSKKFCLTSSVTSFLRA